MIAPGAVCRAGGAPVYSSVAAAYSREPTEGVLGWLGLENDRKVGLVLASRSFVVDPSSPSQPRPSHARSRHTVTWCLVLLSSGTTGWTLAGLLREVRA